MSESSANDQIVPASEPAPNPLEPTSSDDDRADQEPALVPEEPTVGTGSVVAIGCVIAMLLILVLGILLVVWTR